MTSRDGRKANARGHHRGDLVREVQRQVFNVAAHRFKLACTPKGKSHESVTDSFQQLLEEPCTETGMKGRNLGT